MFQPNHPHYGANRRRNRCPTGNKRIGLIAVIGICLFLCGFLVAFETTHDQHILTRIGTQHIPHPIYPHSEPNEEQLAIEDRRKLSGDGNYEREVRKMEALLQTGIQHSFPDIKGLPTYQIMARSFRQGHYEMWEGKEKKDPGYAMESVEHWLRNGGAVVMDRRYKKFAEPDYVEIVLNNAVKLRKEIYDESEHVSLEHIRTVTKDLEKLRAHWIEFKLGAIQEYQMDKGGRYIIKVISRQESK